MPNTKHSDIASYWTNKFILKDGSVCLRNEYIEDYPGIKVVRDETKPCCWACGKEVKKTDQKRVRRDFCSVWDSDEVKGTLERCHIIPKALGGKDAPDNLFLMCERCHALAPDTKNVNAFYRWVHKRNMEYDLGKPSIIKISRLIDEELRERGIKRTLLELINANKNAPMCNMSEEITEYAMQNITTHWGEVSESSLAVVMVDYIMNCIGATPQV